MTYRSASARAAAFDDALREAMSAPVPDAIQPEGAPASDPAAGTPGPEGVAVQTVATDAATYHTGLAAPDSHRVQHPLEHLASIAQRQVCACVECQTWRESERIGRIRRWQAVGERRT